MSSTVTIRVFTLRRRFVRSFVFHSAQSGPSLSTALHFQLNHT